MQAIFEITNLIVKPARLFIIVGTSALINSCLRDDCTTETCYSQCSRVDENCQCVSDSINFHCPSEVAHGIYDYYDCNCRCERGWIGAYCDQRDANFYISFNLGTDTLNLSGPIRTSFYFLFSDASKFFEFEGSFPAGVEIDTITLTQLHGFPLSGAGQRLFCSSDSTCVRLEMLLQSGETAVAVSGVLTADSVTNPHLDFGGTFRANLFTSTGDSLFIRDGKYFLPLLK